MLSNIGAWWMGSNRAQLSPINGFAYASARGSHEKLATIYLMCLLFLGMGFFSSSVAHAQVPEFSVSQTVIPTRVLSYPYRVAVDVLGNVYISNTVANSILKETPSPTGTFSESVVDSNGLASPYGLAVNAGGTIYFADNGHNRIVIDTPSPGGYVQSVMATSSLNYPTGVAVDPSGNVYIADTGNGRILKETPSGSSFSETVVSSSGLLQIVGIAVDSTGNIYVSDIDNMAVYKETLVNGSYVQSTVSTIGLDYPYDVATGASGNLYISDFSNKRIVKETFSGGSTIQADYPSYGLTGALGLAIDNNDTLYVADSFAFNVKMISAKGVNFGPVAVGSQSPTAYLIFTFAGSGPSPTIEGIAILTQGISGLDFSANASGSCATSVTYLSGSMCALGVTMTPRAPGQRIGTAQLLDGSNAILAETYLTGAGKGPLVNFSPAAEVVVESSPSAIPSGIAVDAGANVFATEAQNGFVIKITSQGVPSIVASGLSTPEGVAVDGSGNIYICEAGANRLLKESSSGSGYVQSIVASAGLLSPTAIAVDAVGNVYIADTNNNRVLKETVSGGGYTETVIPTSSLSLPSAIAVDLNGSLYIADTMNNRVLLESLTTGSFIESTIGNNLSGPAGVAIDANGNVYVADAGNQRVLKETLSGGIYSQSVVQTASPTIPVGVAVSSNGNLYLADSGAGRILLEDFVDPPSLNFSATDIGQTSLDSPQTFSLFNFGNEALTFPVSGAGDNPALSTDNFVIDSSTTCPELTPGAIPVILSINASCTYAIKFTPAAAGDLNDALSISDSNLNVRFATQTISLTGTGIQPLTTTLTLAADPLSPVDFQQTETLSVTLSPFSTSAHTTNDEVVSFTQNTVPVGTAALDASGVATLTGVPVLAGANTFQATFAGDAYFTASTSSTATVTSQQLTPIVTWAVPEAISFGTALSATQLNATSSVPGIFAYSPAAGTMPAAGRDTLSVTFTPTDTIDYATITATVTLSVSDFGLAAASGGVTAQSVAAGSPATFSFTVSSVGLPTISNPVGFSVSGLPAGTSFTFMPANLPAGSSGGPITLVVQTTSAMAEIIPDSLQQRIISPGSFASAILILVGLFILAASSLRERFCVPARRVAMSVFAVLVVLELGGCGITSQGPAAPQSSSMTYPFVVTATSGSATHTLSMSLTVHD